MVKPAARLSDHTFCPASGHSSNPIVTGSPDVLIDGLPAARQGDSSECGSALVVGLSSTVLINGLPAATAGSCGTHGNVVMGGSGTVIIGGSFTPSASNRPAFLKAFAQSFAITDSETGQPLASREFVAVVDGHKFFGMTDASGLAHIQAPSAGADISLHVVFKSPAGALTELTEGV